MLQSSLLSVVAGVLAATSTVYALPQSNSGSGSGSSTACNNSPDLCSRSYNNITHMGAHGSSFLRDGNNGLAAAGNQNFNATDALDAGLRLLQAQVHKENNTLRLCHTSCGILDAGPLEDWLTKINVWMKANKNEVVTLLLVNSDDAKPDEFGQAINGSGIAELAYAPATQEPTSEWPTLKSMIDNSTRLVTFVTNIDASTQYPYLMPEFDYVFETAFEVPSLTGFNCTVDRPSKIKDGATAMASNYMGLVNHFKYQSLSDNSDLFVPDTENIDTVNSDGTSEDGQLGKHLQECRQEWGAVPNFVLVDFFEKGQVLAATDKMNGISDATGREEVSDESIGSTTDRQVGMVALTAFVAAAVLLHSDTISLSSLFYLDIIYTAVPLVSNIISIFSIMKSLMIATSCQPISSDFRPTPRPRSLEHRQYIPLILFHLYSQSYFIPLKLELEILTMDYESIATPESCYVDFCLLPIGTGTVSVAEDIAEVQKVLKASGLKYTLHSAGTTVEGSWNEVMAAVGKAHAVVHRRGVVRIQSSMRVGSRTDKKQTAEDKVKRVENLLAKDESK
ncbi:hypothetical protein FOXB_10414 [Fusarium oxysporum f. sp. conglutinans Fo5176]|uniref:Thiamine-binding protein domain-containing protein n=22 Tax=Fusarium TaxID=5506 RepID=F9FVI3_FUSOF|nr:hypothetical protein FOXB_10414 [Fusarium oxysporum f. sp. conglutinans Fo5176]